MTGGIDPDQMPHFAVPDQGLQSALGLSVPILRVTIVYRKVNALCLQHLPLSGHFHQMTI